MASSKGFLLRGNARGVDTTPANIKDRKLYKSSTHVSNLSILDLCEDLCYASAIGVLLCTEAAVCRCSIKKFSIEVSQNSQEKHHFRSSFLNKISDLRPATQLKKRLRLCFPKNFMKLLRALLCT